MSLSPQDIQSKQFHVRFRGFDVEEVDGFLEEVAENFLMLMEENKNIKSQVAELEKELEDLRKEENTFKNAIISAQNIADGMLKKSREEADYLLDETQAEVKRLKDGALKEITELEYQVDHLRGALGNLQTDLRVVIEEYLEVINNPSIITPEEGDNSSDEHESAPTVEIVADAGDDAIEDGQDNDEIEDSDDPDNDEDNELPPSSSALADSGVDLSDLYEKIDLPAEHPAAEEALESETVSSESEEEEETDDNEETLELGSDDSPEINSDVPGKTFPNLDDEIMFTLEDPLDGEPEKKE